MMAIYRVLDKPISLPAGLEFKHLTEQQLKRLKGRLVDDDCNGVYRSVDEVTFKIGEVFELVKGQITELSLGKLHIIDSRSEEISGEKPIKSKRRGLDHGSVDD